MPPFPPPPPHSGDICPFMIKWASYIFCELHFSHLVDVSLVMTPSIRALEDHQSPSLVQVAFLPLKGLTKNVLFHALSFFVEKNCQCSGRQRGEKSRAWVVKVAPVLFFFFFFFFFLVAGSFFATTLVVFQNIKPIPTSSFLHRTARYLARALEKSIKCCTAFSSSLALGRAWSRRSCFVVGGKGASLGAFKICAGDGYDLAFQCSRRLMLRRCEGRTLLALI